MAFLKRKRKDKENVLKPREKRIGDFIIGKTIGEGRYGKVKQAHHYKTGQVVAIKIMKKATLEETDLARIQRELRIMTVLDHPNIVKLYQVIDTPDTTSIIMEFCEGGDLYDYISEYRRLPVEDALKIFRQIVAGLLYCHQHFVIHRDIKPENILLSGTMEVKIGDFGFSRSFSPGKAMETACGSLTYAAPEVIAGKGYVGPKADVWSLGCVLYVLLTGALPFDGANDFEVIPKIRKGEFQHSPFLNGNNMHELITCMLNPDPKKRANLEDIQKHPWAWSDRSMIAMLVRPFANALANRRRALLGEDTEGRGKNNNNENNNGGNVKDPRPRTRAATGNDEKQKSTSKKESMLNVDDSSKRSLKRQLSYFSDSELSAGSSSRRAAEGRKRKLSSSPAPQGVKDKVKSSETNHNVMKDDEDDDDDENENDTEGEDEEQEPLGDPSSPRVQLQKQQQQQQQTTTAGKESGEKKGKSKSGKGRSSSSSKKGRRATEEEVLGFIVSESSTSESEVDASGSPGSSRMRVLKDVDGSASSNDRLGKSNQQLQQQQPQQPSPKVSGLPERASAKKKKAKMRNRMIEEEEEEEGMMDVRPKKAKKGKKVKIGGSQGMLSMDSNSTRQLRSQSVQDRKPVIIMTAKESIKETHSTTETKQARIRSRSNSLPEPEAGLKDKIAKPKKKIAASKDTGEESAKSARKAPTTPPATPKRAKKKKSSTSLASSSSSSGADIIPSESPKKKKREKEKKKKKEKKSRGRSRSAASEDAPTLMMSGTGTTTTTTTTTQPTPPHSPHSSSGSSIGKDHIGPAASLVKHHKIQTRERRSYSTDEGMDRNKFIVLAKRAAKKEKSSLSKEGKND